MLTSSLLYIFKGIFIFLCVVLVPRSSFSFSIIDFCNGHCLAKFLYTAILASLEDLLLFLYTENVPDFFLSSFEKCYPSFVLESGGSCIPS